MPRRTILIVGALEQPCNQDDVLQALRTATEGADSGEPVAWEWVMAHRPAYRLPRDSRLNRFLYEATDSIAQTVLVMLKCLNGDDRGRLLKKQSDPVRVPKTVTVGSELVDWLLDPDNGLVPRQEWWASAREASFFAILAKLLKNKAWANGPQNHNFTQEADLLGQAPVSVHSSVQAEAVNLLDKMNEVLLVTKGSSQGTTKKEWAIYLPKLGVVMDAFLSASLGPLESDASLGPLLRYVRGGTSAPLLRVDEFVQVQRVRAICRTERLAPRR
jgi:hypothetical protein